MAKFSIWMPLASTLLAIAWLLPNASPPWGAFHKDAWAAIVFLMLSIVFVFRKVSEHRRYLMDPFSATLMLLGVFVLGQCWAGTIYFSGHAAMGVGYILASSTVVVIGRAWEDSQPRAPGDFLFLAFLIAALVTTALMVTQWLGVWETGVWVNELGSARRPFGNLVQPNNAATLLLLGMVSMYWFWSTKKLSIAVGMLGAAYFLFFVCLTGSRIGYVSLVSMAALALVQSYRHVELRPIRPILGVLLLLLPLFVLILSYGWASLEGDVGAHVNLGDRPLTAIRALLYRAYLDVAITSPLWGSGFGLGAKAQLTAAALGYDLSGLFTWTHNAFLDVAVWFGIPAALALLASVVTILISFTRSQFCTKRCAYFAGIYVVFMHAMVELPHGYAYFLLPTCMLVGAMLSGLTVLSVGVARLFVVSNIALLGALLVLIVPDYLRAESSFYTWRFKYANVGRAHPMDIPETRLLNQFPALLKGLRGSADTMDQRAVIDFEQAVLLFPSAAALQHLAEIQLMKGDVAKAQETAERARVLTKPSERRAMAARWRFLGKDDSRFLAVEWRE